MEAFSRPRRRTERQRIHTKLYFYGSVVDNNNNNNNNEMDKARLLAATATHSGDWLQAAPIASVGLKLSDEAVRVAVAHRLGCRAREPHTCVCGKNVDARGLHGLACRRSAPRQQRHSHMNDILWRSIKRAQLPAVKEPISLV